MPSARPRLVNRIFWIRNLVRKSRTITRKRNRGKGPIQIILSYLQATSDRWLFCCWFRRWVFRARCWRSGERWRWADRRYRERRRQARESGRVGGALFLDYLRTGRLFPRHFCLWRQYFDLLALAFVRSRLVCWRNPNYRKIASRRIQEHSRSAIGRLVAHHANGQAIS